MIWWHKTHICYFYLNIKIDLKAFNVFLQHIHDNWPGYPNPFSITSWRSHFLYGTNEISNNISIITVTVELCHICDNHSRQSLYVLHRHVASFPRNKYVTVLVRSCTKHRCEYEEINREMTRVSPPPQVPVKLKY